MRIVTGPLPRLLNAPSSEPAAVFGRNRAQPRATARGQGGSLGSETIGGVPARDRFRIEQIVGRINWQEDIGDAWTDDHSGVPSEIWEFCYQLGTNVLFYAHSEYSKWLQARKPNR